MTLVLGIAINPYWSIIPGFLTLFVTFFFRNPKRIIPNDPTLILSPADGKITFQQYTYGWFKPAYKKSAPFQNERHTIGLEAGAIKILVTQIAGIIARRIISWVALGDQLEQGQRYGMIKFGSCTEITVPINVDILITAGEHVKGGTTILGKICQPPK